jgi:hypothetical protein
MWVRDENSESGRSYLMSLTIDHGARTASVDSFGSARIVTNPDNEFLLFKAEPGSVMGVSTGTVNRITGDVSVEIISLTDGLYKFYGRCSQPVTSRAQPPR